MQRQSRSQFRFPFPPCHAGRDASLQGEIAGGSFSFFFFFFFLLFSVSIPSRACLVFQGDLSGNMGRNEWIGP